MLVSPTRMMVIQSPLRPSLDLNFLSSNLDSRITFTRASAGWAFNSAGTLTSYATNTPRFDYDKDTLASNGLLIEEARTNSLRNNSGTGGVVGTPGTLPTNWNVVAAANLTTNVVAVGTENGIPYTDIQIVGTTNSTQYAISPESLTQIVASNTQAWTCSGYVKLVAGTTTNITNTRLTINGRTAAGAGVAAQSGAFNHTLTSTLTRTSGSFTMSDATVARVSMEYRLIFSSGVAVDITVRLGGLQLELGAFASSPILTTAAAVTRAADVATITTLTPWFNESEGTLVAEVLVPYQTSLSTTGVSFGMSDGSFNNVAYLSHSTTADSLSIQSGGVQQASLSSASPPLTVKKIAGAYRLNDFAGCRNGGTVSTDTSGTVPVAPIQARIGSAPWTSGNYLNGYIRRISYYNRRLPNATLQRITA